MMSWTERLLKWNEVMLKKDHTRGIKQAKAEIKINARASQQLTKE